MKKLMIFWIFYFCSLPLIKATEQIGIKIGNELTLYTFYDCNEHNDNNYWGEDVIIERKILIPSDAYFKGLNIPKESWDYLSSNKNGIYDSRLEKLTQESSQLKVDYNKQFAENTKMHKLITSLEIALSLALITVLCLLLHLNTLRLRKKGEWAVY